MRGQHQAPKPRLVMAGLPICVVLVLCRLAGSLTSVEDVR
jgi:hypothetical protein